MQENNEGHDCKDVNKSVKYQNAHKLYAHMMYIYHF